MEYCRQQHPRDRVHQPSQPNWKLPRRDQIAGNEAHPCNYDFCKNATKRSSFKHEGPGKRRLENNRLNLKREIHHGRTVLNIPILLFAWPSSCENNPSRRQARRERFDANQLRIDT